MASPPFDDDAFEDSPCYLPEESDPIEYASEKVKESIPEPVVEPVPESSLESFPELREEPLRDSTPQFTQEIESTPLPPTQAITDVDTDADADVDDDDESSPSWRGHSKHFLILSNAGKPIWSRYGDENKLAGLSGVLQAIVSFVQNNSGDVIRSITAGEHQILFLIKGPIYLVSISRTLEPLPFLRDQLELLHGQLIMILTNAINRSFARNPKFDLRNLLGGTRRVFKSLTDSFSRNYASILKAYSCLRLPRLARRFASLALQEGASSSGAVFGILFSGDKVVTLVQRKKTAFQAFDIFLLLNFINASDSFRTSESFTPVCLPRFNPNAFLYAYVAYIDRNLCLTFLTEDSGSFFSLKSARTSFERKLNENGSMVQILAAMTAGGLLVDRLLGEGPDGRSSVVDVAADYLLPSLEDDDSVESTAGSSSLEGGSQSLGPGVPAVRVDGALHFLFRNNQKEQFVSADFPFPISASVDLQERLFRTYQRVRASVIGDERACSRQKMQYRQDGNFCVYCWFTKERELYVSFDALSDKRAAISLCTAIYGRLQALENELFLLEPGVTL